MMRRTTAPFIGFALLSATALYAQNLVKNPGFEASDHNIAPWQVRKGDASKFVKTRWSSRTRRSACWMTTRSSFK